jgi:hypothetical protein
VRLQPSQWWRNGEGNSHFLVFQNHVLRVISLPGHFSVPTTHFKCDKQVVAHCMLSHYNSSPVLWRIMHDRVISFHTTVKTEQPYVISYSIWMTFWHVSWFMHTVYLHSHQRVPWVCLAFVMGRYFLHSEAFTIPICIHKFFVWSTSVVTECKCMQMNIVPAITMLFSQVVVFRSVCVQIR